MRPSLDFSPATTGTCYILQEKKNLEIIRNIITLEMIGAKYLKVIFPLKMKSEAKTERRHLIKKVK